MLLNKSHKPHTPHLHPLQATPLSTLQGSRRGGLGGLKPQSRFSSQLCLHPSPPHPPPDFYFSAECALLGQEGLRRDLPGPRGRMRSLTLAKGGDGSSTHLGNAPAFVPLSSVTKGKLSNQKRGIRRSTRGWVFVALLHVPLFPGVGAFAAHLAGEEILTHSSPLGSGLSSAKSACEVPGKSLHFSAA